MNKNCRGTIGRATFGLALCVLMLVPVLPCWGWGPEGHRITAEIAQRHLTQKAQEVLRREFNIIRLEKVSNWADQIKGKKKSTRSWHYTNIPQGLLTYERHRDCPDDNCVIEKTKQFEVVLAEKGRFRRERIEALKYLVHFVADVHQPLHLGNRVDRGGNEIEFIFNGKPTNLHALWDHGLIAHPGKSLLEYAAVLDQKIDPKEISAWTSSDVNRWAEESRALALKQAYPLELDARGEPSREYLEQGRAVVARRLQQGGVRLAHILNQLFK